MGKIKKVDQAAVPPEPPPLHDRQSKAPATRDAPPVAVYMPPGSKIPEVPKPGAEALMKGAQRIAGGPYADKEMIGMGLNEKDEGMVLAYLRAKPGGFKALGGMSPDQRFVVGRNEYVALAEFDNKANALKAVEELKMLVDGKFGVVRYNDPSRGGKEHFLILTPGQMAKLSEQSWELPVGVEIVG